MANQSRQRIKGAGMSVFPNFTERYGSPANLQTPDEAVFRKYATLLPPDLVSFWRETGWGSYENAFLWTVNPDTFNNLLPQWTDSSSTCYVYARTAFAALIFWDGRRSNLLDPRFDEITPLLPDVRGVFEFTFSRDNELLDELMDRPLFLEALPELGPPAIDECYGHFPALALGGEHSAQSLERVKLREHLTLLSQLRDPA
jgi:hypothetical protein